jgi:hypothetical protein
MFSFQSQQQKVNQWNGFIDPSMVSGVIQGVSNLGASAIQLANKQGLQGEVKAACGSRPLLNWGGKKDAYEACAANYTASVLKSKQALTQAQIQANAVKTGLSNGAIIAISLGGLTVLSLSLYLIFKK